MKTKSLETHYKLKLFLKLSHFPPVENATEDGIVAYGGDLESDVLLDAYLHGIFPWPHEGMPLLWFCPPERGILFFQDLHVGRTLQKIIDKKTYTFKINTQFNKVLDHCSKVPRKGQKGTWITTSIKKAYKKLFQEGHAISLECYKGPKLVGGIYGVFVAGVFSGESMFGLEDNVSKLCVIQMAEFLESQGIKWMDIQMVTPVLEYLGGKYVSREDYLQLLKQSQKKYFSQNRP